MSVRIQRFKGLIGFIRIYDFIKYSELQNLWTELGVISLVDCQEIVNKTWKQQYFEKSLLYKLEIRLQTI